MGPVGPTAPGPGPREASAPCQIPALGGQWVVRSSAKFDAWAPKFPYMFWFVQAWAQHQYVAIR